MGDESVLYSVDDALVSLGFGKFQTLVLVYSGIAYAAEAMEVMILSFIGSAVQSEWNLSPREKSLISSVVFAGMLVGAYSGGIIADNYGRRKGFFYTAVVTGGMGFISSFSPNYIWLIILRFFVGIGVGGGPVLFSWFLEFVPAPNRGAWMMVFSIFWSMGTILEAALAWAVMPKLGWRWLLALSSVPSLLLLVLYGLTPESPRYFCMKGRTSDAVHVLEKMARMNQKALPSGELAFEHKAEAGEVNADANSDRVHKDENSFTKNLASKIECIGALYKLLSRKLIRATLLLWMAFSGNTFAYYGVVLLTSALSGGDAKCSPGNSQSDSLEGNKLYTDVFITSFAELPGLILSAIIVDRIGRKLSIVFMLFATFVFLIPLIFHQKDAAIKALLFCARLCITGSINTLCIYAPEVYPTSLRSTGFGTADALGRIGGILSPLVAVGLVDSCRQAEAIILYEAVIFLSGMAVAFFPVETKGSQLKDFPESSSRSTAQQSAHV